MPHFHKLIPANHNILDVFHLVLHLITKFYELCEDVASALTVEHRATGTNYSELFKAAMEEALPACAPACTSVGTGFCAGACARGVRECGEVCARVCVGVHAFEGVDNGECVMMMMCFLVPTGASSLDPRAPSRDARRASSLA